MILHLQSRPTKNNGEGAWESEDWAESPPLPYNRTTTQSFPKKESAQQARFNGYLFETKQVPKTFHDGHMIWLMIKEHLRHVMDFHSGLSHEEAYLEFSRKSTIELFRKNSLRRLAINHFC